MTIAQPFTADSENAFIVTHHTVTQDAVLLDAPDPEPGWVTRYPNWALAFFFLSPRPCAALDELMSLGH